MDTIRFIYKPVAIFNHDGNQRTASFIDSTIISNVTYENQHALICWFSFNRRDTPRSDIFQLEFAMCDTILK